jgi:hypothetical protein
MAPVRLVWTFVAVIVCTFTVMACVPQAVTRPIGTMGVGTEYRVSCTAESACYASIAKTCPTGHYMLAGYYNPTAVIPPMKQPLNFDFMCASHKQAATDAPAKQQTIQVFISPECKSAFYGPDFIKLDANGNEVGTERRPKPDFVGWDPARAVPMSYKDPRTSIAIYVENDGRHLAAFDSQGKLLWVRNPWEEGDAFCPYRTPRPVVASLKMAVHTEPGWTSLKSRGANLAHSFLVVTFDSSQFGSLDESTGDFFPEGQN